LGYSTFGVGLLWGCLLPAGASFYLKDSIKRQKVQENSSSSGAALELVEPVRQLLILAWVKMGDGSFDIFGVNYGGEIAERALQKIKPVCSVLTSVGIPVCVKFQFILHTG
jgi:hypothetical protein